MSASSWPFSTPNPLRQQLSMSAFETIPELRQQLPDPFALINQFQLFEDTTPPTRCKGKTCPARFHRKGSKIQFQN